MADKGKEGGKRNDLQVRDMEVAPQTRTPLVANQTVDLECSSTTHNRERENQVSFSTSFFIVGTRMLVLAESPVKNWSDLAGKNVVVSRSEEHTSELQSLMRISYAVFCLKKKKQTIQSKKYPERSYLSDI